MTGSALNLAFKLVICHDELENVNPGVLRDALAEVSGTPILRLYLEYTVYFLKPVPSATCGKDTEGTIFMTPALQLPITGNIPCFSWERILKTIKQLNNFIWNNRKVGTKLYLLPIGPNIIF